MFQQTPFAKKSELSKIVFFVDFDGTLFTPDKKIITAPFYNFQTQSILRRYQIPFVVVTGRSTWTRKSDLETMVLGLAKPDAVIAGAGSIIYYRLPNGQLALDTSWEKQMSQSTIQWHHNKKILWNREIILQNIHHLLPQNVRILPHSSDKYLIRLYVKEMTIKELMQIKETLEDYFNKSIQVIFTEKLLQQNTLDIFSGNILLVPTTAGKENAVKYLLNLLPQDKDVFCFGDATIDVPMLTIKSEPKKFTIHTYGVNLTPLAKKLLQNQSKSNPQLHIIENPHSPKAILEVTRNLSSRAERSVVEGSHTTKSKNHFTPAQNTFTRRLLQPFESFLDTFFDQNLTANDISFKGLEMVKQSIDLLYEKKTRNPLHKLTIWKLYTVGNLTDIFDGIRARQTNTISNQGQLIDVFCDRAKEFYQLYQRASHIIVSETRQSRQQGYQIFLTAISCILPSIARAQAESSGIILKEQDAQGGSMLARTRRLSFSFFFETLGLHEESFVIDQRIYTTNIATYQNRLNSIPSTGGANEVGGWVTTSQQNSTSLQKKAQERFLLLVQLLQEENEIIEKALKDYPELSKRYEKEFKKYIEKYLKLDVRKLREEHNIQSPLKLSLYK
ncbi:MAG TPA: HAD family hydrolase [Candidatus Saccharimonadales bacterium]|nr:HAD family hydrolase [Candidatus Saccharimonadales bacterium]